MNELLQIFYSNKPEFEAVKLFLKQTTDKIALESLYEGKTDEANACAQASKVVGRAFSELEEMFKPIIKSSLTNKAR